MLTAKGMRFPINVILVCVRWHAAYLLSYRHLEKMMQERKCVCRPFLHQPLGGPISARA